MKDFSLSLTTRSNFYIYSALGLALLTWYHQTPASEEEYYFPILFLNLYLLCLQTSWPNF